VDRRSFLAAGAATSLVPSLLPGLLRAQPGDAYAPILGQVLRLSPETATSYGLDRGANADLKHRLDDRSPAHRFNYYDAISAGAAAVRARPAANPRDAIFRNTVLWLADSIAPFHAFPYGGISGFAYPVPYVVSQVSGTYQAIPDFLDTQHVVETRDDAEAYLDRLAAFAVALDQETAQVHADAGRGVIPPAVILERTLAQLASFQGEQRGASAGLVTALVRKTRDKQIPGDWAGRAQALVDGAIAAAAARQVAALTGLKASAPAAVGVGTLPDGGAYYAHALRFHTTTPLTPDQAHQLGLHQVAEISAQVRAIFAQQGVNASDLSAAFKALAANPAYLFPNDDAGRAALLDYIRGLVKDMYGRLPRAFAHIPKTPLEVRRVPPATELGAPGAYSQTGSIDGTRPGNIYFNLHDTANWPRWAIPTTAYHEGVPGHHLQGSIANETTDLPALFKILGFNAYAEGWALYAEQLAGELGAYDAEPLGRLGQLQGSLFRACRIVVDTGLHSKGWSRETAIAYLIDNAGSTPDDARREIERYCSWPGQACAYKIGHLEFVRLRELARSRLGPRFDLKGFHDAVLDYGGLPLEVMGQAVDLWMKSVA
jgi:uncharacterized protein (DUF885 family)